MKFCLEMYDVSISTNVTVLNAALNAPLWAAKRASSDSTVVQPDMFAMYAPAAPCG